MGFGLDARTGSSRGTYLFTKGVTQMTFSRKTLWIGTALVAVAVLVVVLVLVYSGGSGGGGGY